MPKAVINIGVFVIGFLIAVVVVYRNNFSLFPSNAQLHPTRKETGKENQEQQEGPLNVKPLSSEPEASTSSPSDLNAKEQISHEIQAAPSPSASSKPGTLDNILQAIQLANPKSLQAVRTEEIQRIPDYRFTVLPALKRQSLETLLKKFSPSDWKAWPKAALLTVAGSARLYVDDVTTVNPELGSFLETAAQLLHALFVSTQNAEVYELEKGMQEIIGKAEQLLAYRKKTAVPARYMLLAEIIRDPVLVSIFERERGNLIAAYITEHPKDLNADFKLIRSLDPKYCDGSVDMAVAKAVYRLSLEGSAQFREQVLLDELRRRTLQGFVDVGPEGRMKRALANLYLVAATDAYVEFHDKVQAKKFLRESLAVQSGLEAQKILEKYLSEGEVLPTLAESNKDVSVSKSKPKQPIEEESSSSIRSEHETPWLLLMVVVALLCFLPMGVLALLKHWRVRRDIRLHEQNLSQQLGEETAPEGELIIQETQPSFPSTLPELPDLEEREKKPKVVGE